MKTDASQVLASKLNSWLVSKGTVGGYYGWTVKTKIGLLEIRVYDDWVACRFDGDLEPVRKHFGIHTINQGRLNPFSGKWNFHVWEVLPHDYKPRNGKYGRDSLTKLAKAFIEEVEKILPATA